MSRRRGKHGGLELDGIAQEALVAQNLMAQFEKERGNLSGCQDQQVSTEDCSWTPRRFLLQGSIANQQKECGNLSMYQGHPASIVGLEAAWKWMLRRVWPEVLVGGSGWGL